MEQLSKLDKKKKFGEVFTPPELVNEILDNFPKDVWKDPTQTWLDNSCGEGAFLIQIKNRLMISLKEWEPDDKKREFHILDKMIFGVEIQFDNWKKCRTNLGLSPTGNDGNIVCCDSLTYNYSFIKDDSGGYVLEQNTFNELFT